MRGTDGNFDLARSRWSDIYEEAEHSAAVFQSGLEHGVILTSSLCTRSQKCTMKRVKRGRLLNPNCLVILVLTYINPNRRTCTGEHS